MVGQILLKKRGQRDQYFMNVCMYCGSRTGGKQKKYWFLSETEEQRDTE